MSNVDPNAAPFDDGTLYRQRITETGWRGLALFVISSLAAYYCQGEFFLNKSMAITSSYDSLTEKYSDAAVGWGIGAICLGSLAIIGLMLILTGREHYPFKPENQ